jgi:hypothetical protein
MESAERPNEAQTQEQIAAAADGIKSMVDRLEPGQMLRMTDAEPGTFIYARIVPREAYWQDKVIGRVFVDEDFLDGPRKVIDQMVQSGELQETCFCSHWKRP